MSAQNTLHHSTIIDVIQVLREFGAYSLRSRNKGADIMDGGEHWREMTMNQVKVLKVLMFPRWGKITHN